MRNLGKEKNLPNYGATASFLEIILIWWSIVNVKSTAKGKRLNNDYCTPLTCNENDEKYNFLLRFQNWLEIWEALPGGKLTRETFTAIKHTTYAITEITRYCKDELHMTYILPGKFQTDNLESRFGEYRQLAGGNYNISVRQLFECENKIRKLSVMNMVLPFHEKNVANTKAF